MDYVCEYCGVPVGLYGHGPGYPKLHCNDRLCRAVSAFWCTHNVANAPGAARFYHAWRGPLVRYYLLADFLRRMAAPKSEREIEFAKRYAHRLTAPTGTIATAAMRR